MKDFHAGVVGVAQEGKDGFGEETEVFGDDPFAGGRDGAVEGGEEFDAGAGFPVAIFGGGVGGGDGVVFVEAAEVVDADDVVP